MPAEEQVVIQIDIKSNLAKDRAEMEAFFRSLRKESKLLEKDLDRLEKRQSALRGRFNETSKSGNKMNRTLEKMKKALSSVGKFAETFMSKFAKFSFIGVAIELGLVGAALLSVKLIMASSRFIMRAYQATLTGLGIAAGGVAVALGSVAAAMREMQEVQLAPWVGGLRNATIALRNTFNDDMISFFGMEGIQGAVTALARGGVDASSGYTRILKQLGDFTPDPKELSELAKAYADIKKSGIVSDTSFATLSKVNPTLTAGLGELAGLDSKGLEAAVSGGKIDASLFESVLAGDASATDAFEGQLARLNSTVIGQLKGMIPRLLQQFSDLGQPFLQSLWEVMRDLEGIIERTITRIRTVVTSFGLDSMIPGMVSLFQGFNDWIVVLVNSSLPKVEGWVERMDGMMTRMRGWFIGVGQLFAPLEEGADILWDVIKNALGPFFTGFGSLVTGLNALLIDNKQAFLEFGNAFGRVFSAIMDWFQGANNAFAEALPVWSNLLDVVAEQLVPAMGDMFTMMHKASLTWLPAVASALSAVAGAMVAVSGAISRLLKIPGIGLLLAGLMAPKILGGGLVRGGVSSIARGGVGIVAGSMGVKGMAGIAGSVGGAAAAGGAGVVAASGIVAAGAGTYIGDRVEGTGGVMAGIGAGAASGAALGAGIGSLIGPLGTAAGAAIGGVTGGIVGGVSAFLAQGRQKKLLEEAGAAITNSIAQEAEREAAIRWFGIARERTDALAAITGRTTDEIGKLAVALNMDLGSATGSVIEQMKTLREISDFDFTLAGSQDVSTNSFLDSLFGGSEFQKNYLAPEFANSSDAALQEILAIEKDGGAIPSSLIRTFFEANTSFIQAAYGSSGSDLAESFIYEAQRLKDEFGTDFALKFVPDVVAGLEARTSLENTDMKALLSSIFDFVGPDGMGGLTQTEAANKIFEEKSQILQGTLLTNAGEFDEVLQGMITSFMTQDITQKQVALADSLGILGLAVDDLSEKLKVDFGLKPEYGTNEDGTRRHKGNFGQNDKPLGYITSSNMEARNILLNNDLSGDTSVVNNIKPVTNITLDMAGILERLAIEQEKANRNALQRASDATSSYTSLPGG